MATKPQVGVIGLGKFGYKFGITLLNLGYKVLGIDSELFVCPDHKLDIDSIRYHREHIYKR